MSQKQRNEFNCSDSELKKMMFELCVDSNVDVAKLRMAFIKQIRQHHTDKGGSCEKAKELTKSYRILKSCIEENIQLPNLYSFNDAKPTYSKSASRPAYQAPQNTHNPFDDDNFEDFISAKQKRKKPRGKDSTHGPGKFTQHKNDHREDQYFWSSDNSDNEDCFLDLSKKVFINGYQYTNDDLRDFDDCFENKNININDYRTIRGGLTLREDFLKSLAENQFIDIEGLSEIDEAEFVVNQKFEPILKTLFNCEEGIYHFAEKMKMFANLEWAIAAELQSSCVISSVCLTKLADPNNCLYEFTLSPNNIKYFDFFSAGLYVIVRSCIDNNVFCTAMVDNVIDEQNKIILFFFNQFQISILLMNTKIVDININSSAFTYRSMVRSINFIQELQMENIVLPTLQFYETYKDFELRRYHEIQALEFLDTDSYNVTQKNAVFSIVSKVHQPYPFILFGPPGTGKTITLIESIRQLTLQSKNNRILVCTPSKMAADNLAESLLKKNFIDSKYVFRMHSLSATTLSRNKKLDLISYFSKEGHGRFYGIPNSLNLRVFRIIISTLLTSSYLISAGGFRGYFSHIFVDEAGQATETNTWIPIGGLAENNTSIILSGDPKQLGPVVENNVLKTFGYSISMLKRLIYSDAYEKSDDRSMVILKQTYRSHMKIVRPCSYLFYDNMLIASEENEVIYKLCKWKGLPTKDFPIIFFSSAGSKEEQEFNKSFSNQLEAEKVVDFVERIIAETDTKETDVGIISPYKNQVIKLRKLLVKHPRLTIDSVEAFQGSEREVIIISTVRTKKLGFLNCDLRLNTSISRAKSLLIVIGDDSLLNNHITWRKFIYYCRYHGGYLKSVDLKQFALEEVK